MHFVIEINIPINWHDLWYGRQLPSFAIVINMNSFQLLLGLYVLIYTCDCVRRHLDPPNAARAVQMIQDGHSHRNVARTLDVSQSVVARLWACYQEMGQYTRRPGQGRSRCTTDADDRYIRLMALRNRRGSAQG